MPRSSVNSGLDIKRSCESGAPSRPCRVLLIGGLLCLLLVLAFGFQHHSQPFIHFVEVRTARVEWHSQFTRLALNARQARRPLIELRAHSFTLLLDCISKSARSAVHQVATEGGGKYISEHPIIGLDVELARGNAPHLP